MRLSIKLLLISELVLLVAVTLLVVPVWTAMRRQVIRDLQGELRAVAATAALQVDGDAHGLIRTMDDAHTEAFAALRRQLRQVQQANDIKLNQIYTFYRDGDVMRFAVMLNPMDELFIGRTYPLRAEMRPVLERGATAVTELYTDQFGQWISAYAPIRDAEGEVIGLLEVDRNSQEYLTGVYAYARLTIALGLGALVISSLLGWWVLQRIVIGPLSRIREGVVALGRRDFAHRVALETNDELQDLGETLNSIASQLDVARIVQEGFFPRTLPAHAGYRLAGRSVPCDATGGDYYDAFALDGDRLGVLVADVSGHGLGASLLMASCRAALRGLSRLHRAPGELIEQLQVILQDELTDGRFITLIYGVLEGDGTFSYTNFGHAPAWVVRGGRQQPLPSHRPPLGVTLDSHDGVPQSTITLAPGDRVFLASDGLPEAIAADGRQLGLGAVEPIVTDKAMTCREVVQRLHDLVADHCGGAPASDDVTILCVDRL